MPSKTLKIWAIVVAALVVLPLLHTLLLVNSGTMVLADTKYTYLFLLFEIPIWATLVAFFVLETTRYQLFKPIKQIGCATSLGLFGLLTPLIAVVISPAVKEMSIPITATLSVTGCLIGFLAGGVYWIAVFKKKANKNGQQKS